jgi:hypothetical protein
VGKDQPAAKNVDRPGVAYEANGYPILHRFEIYAVLIDLATSQILNVTRYADSFMAMTTADAVTPVPGL